MPPIGFLILRSRVRIASGAFSFPPLGHSASSNLLESLSNKSPQRMVEGKVTLRHPHYFGPSPRIVSPAAYRKRLTQKVFSFALAVESPA